MTYETLFALQELDGKIDDAQARIRKLKKDYADCQHSAEALEKSAQEQTRLKQETQVKVRKLEKEIEALEQALKTHEQKAMQVTSTKQMEAMQHQKDATSAKKDATEEELLETYSALEKVESTLSEVTARAEKEKERKEKLGQEARAEVKVLDAQIKDLTSRRPETSAQVEASLLSRYQSLRDHYGDRVVFGVEDPGCPGCGHSQNSAGAKRLRAGGKACECENCGRLLVWEGLPD